jgi:type VI secretion system protein ImpL
MERIKPKMRKFVQCIYQPNLLKSAVSSILLLVFFWWVAPYIAIAGYAPFIYFPIKLIITFLVIAFWCFRVFPYLLLCYPYLKKYLKSIQNNTLLHVKEKRVLRHFSRPVSKCLRSLNKSKSPLLLPDKRPWILVLGPKGAGKSQLLKNSNIGLTCTPYPALGFSIWQNQQSVFFELASDYLENDHAILKWQFKKLISKICRYHGENFLSSIAIVLDLAFLKTLEKHRVVDFIQALRKKLQWICEFRYFVPVTITLTKCDLLEGFIPFFSELTQKERSQPLGIELVSEDSNYLLQDQFIEQYARFMQVMNNRLVWLFHHEPNLQKRRYMQRLIIELEKIEVILEKYFISVQWGTNNPLKGIYFTSSEHKTEEAFVSFIQPQEISKYLIDETEGQSKSESQSFFSNNLLKQMMRWKDDHQYQSKTFYRRVVFFVGGSLCVALITFVIQAEYKQARTRLVNVNGMLRSEAVHEVIASSNWQYQLNALNDINKNIQKQAKFKFNWFEWLVFFPTAKAAKQLYEYGLKQLLIPELEKTIFLNMQQAISSSNINLYYALKVYLMLTQRAHLDKEFVKKWFFSAWATQYKFSFDQQDDLLQHLRYLLNSNLLPLSINQPLVNKIRERLLQLPKAELIFAVLVDDYKKAPVLLFKGQEDILGFELTRLTIPAFYDPKQFKTIYNETIPGFIKRGQMENWVIGKISINQSSDDALSQLTDGVRRLYLQNYAQNWLNVLTQISFKKATSLKELTRTLVLLRHSNSPFWEFIRVILYNTMLNANNVSTLQSPYNHLFSQLSQLTQGGESYRHMEEVLKSFDQYLSNIIKSKDSQKAAYLAALERIQQTSSNDILTQMNKGITDLPLPLQRILHQFSVEAWQLILEQASQYLNLQWQTLVWAPYKKTLIDRYPLFERSHTDIPLQQFKTFFSPHGVIDTFFSKYLKPFVNTQKAYWVWQTFDGLSLPMPQTTLDIFIRASLIKQMFFSENENQILFKFSITPEMLSSTVKQCIISIGDQKMIITPDNFVSYTFAWPTTQQRSEVTFISKTNQKTYLIKDGTWAWFRLLGEAKLSTTESPKVYRLIFEKDNRRIELKLTTPHLINPYVPNILQAFRCPVSLL